MPVRKVQVGQVWKQDGTGDTYLVTKLYPEALATMAILRKVGAENQSPVKVKVQQAGNGQTLPGFAPEHGEDNL
jgi:hypothetical protein